MAKKYPAFQFYPGDWMKDSSLRVCSVFARGLLIDLLCLCFDSASRGVLCFQDGSPWTDEDIANAISGADKSKIIDGIRELESKNVLSRDENGALYSRRMVRDEEFRQKKASAGAIGGKQTRSKPKANGVAKQGSSTSSSTSSSDKSSKELIPENLRTPEFESAWSDWKAHRKEIRHPLTPTQTEKQLAQFSAWGAARAIAAIEYTVWKGWQGIQEPEKSSPQKTYSAGKNQQDEMDDFLNGGES